MYIYIYTVFIGKYELVLALILRFVHLHTTFWTNQWKLEWVNRLSFLSWVMLFFNFGKEDV